MSAPRETKPDLARRLLYWGQPVQSGLVSGVRYESFSLKDSVHMGVCWFLLREDQDLRGESSGQSTPRVAYVLTCKSELPRVRPTIRSTKERKLWMMYPSPQRKV